MALYDYPKTLPYVYCSLAESCYHKDPLQFIKTTYKTNIDEEIVIKERESAKGWDYILFEDKKNNSLIIGFRGTQIIKQPTDIIYDLLNEIGTTQHKPIVIEMSKVVSLWLDKYNNNNQYDQVTFVGHSEGGLYARYVLYQDKRINCRITFNSALPKDVYNFRSLDDPITLITGFEKRQIDIWIKHKQPGNNVWTICKGGHEIHNFRKSGVLIHENNQRKTWHQVNQLQKEFEQKFIGDGHMSLAVKEWFDNRNSTTKKRLKIGIIIAVSSFICYRIFIRQRRE